jgi:FkbM family methyltransferase
VNDVKQVGGVWLPIQEEHMSKWMVDRMRAHPEEIVNGRATYQYHKLVAALKWVKNFRTAIDVGAHCGLWSMHLATRFAALHAFEPVALHRKCFELNVEKSEDRAVVLYDCGLGEEEKDVAFHLTPGSSGDSWVEDKPGDVPIRRLDSYEIADVDFIKLDCEGYELFALRGGEETLVRCRPCVIVEQKPGRAQKYGLAQTEAVGYLQGLGAVLRREIGGDYILSWDKVEPEHEETDV